jgi:hypothetical protein
MVIDMNILKPNQSQEELKIFRSFAKHYPCKIRTDSIKKRKPPEPDILCELINGNKIAFELVECLDENIAKVTVDASVLKKQTDLLIKDLPKKDKNKFIDKYSNAIITINFGNKCSLTKRKNVIPNLLKYLLEAPKTLNGEVISPINSPKALEDIDIKKCSINGPIIMVPPSAVFFADPSIKIIKAKFSKRYETPYKIELVAYYSLQPEIPINHFLDGFIDYVEKNIATSQFERVWLYSYTKDDIIYNS